MTALTEQDFKTIFARRDPRYDGRFYVGVQTTGIYCRPICPAQPKAENVVIFRSMSEAENAGYRPCLRCHPDLAPGNRLWDGTINTVSRALRLINDSTHDELSIEHLATALGLTARHVRRLFDQHVGASPVEMMITRRLHFAKQAIRETRTPITEIAFASGFQSIRRFNEAFKARFHQSPSAFRQAHPAPNPEGPLALKIPIHQPYDWDSVIAYLKRHATGGIESVEGQSYRRYVALKKGFGSVRITPRQEQPFLIAEFTDIPLIQIRSVLTRLKKLFDTDHNPIHLPVQDTLIPRGIRVPGSFDPFETAVAIILGQLVSTDHAKVKQTALVQAYGRPLGKDGDTQVFAFPTPAVLSHARVHKIGLTRGKATAIRALARAVNQGKLNFQSHQEFSQVKAQLLAMKGIGPWTAMMIGMRCLGDPDAFPETDLIIERAIKHAGIQPETWASSRAYLTHCLWREFSEKLSKK